MAGLVIVGLLILGLVIAGVVATKLMAWEMGVVWLEVMVTVIPVLCVMFISI